MLSAMPYGTYQNHTLRTGVSTVLTTYQNLCTNVLPDTRVLRMLIRFHRPKE